MIHGLKASSYYTISCPYEFLRRHPLLSSFLILFLAPNRLCAQGFRANCSPCVFRARWVWPRLRLSLGYPPCYPSPVLIASSNASSPHSSSLWALSAVRCRCAWGRATLVLARNCSSALVALGSPRSRPCGCSSAAVGLVIPPSSRSL